MHDWDELAAKAAARARVVAYDKPGFGASDKPASFDATPDGYARHLERFLDALAIRRAHLGAARPRDAHWMIASSEVWSG